ncbi:metal-sensitive transcriptional regulator [Thermincola ferriacetica]
MQNLDVKDQLEKRLKRVEGQVKGIRKMIQEGKNCQDILTQVAAARAALKMVGNLILNHYAVECMAKSMQTDEMESKLEELQKLVKILTRFAE